MMNFLLVKPGLSRVSSLPRPLPVLWPVSPVASEPMASEPVSLWLASWAEAPPCVIWTS
jgi:hypothetical protein